MEAGRAGSRTGDSFATGVAAAAAALGALTFLAVAFPFVQGWTSLQFGWRASPAGDVITVDPRGPAAGRLQPGDRVLAIDGDTRVSGAIDAHLASKSPQATYVLRVARGNDARDVKLFPVLGAAQETQRVVPSLAGAVLSVALGVWLGRARPRDPMCRTSAVANFLLAADCIGFAVGPYASPTLEARSLHALLLLTRPMPYAALYHFTAIFPTGRRPAGITGRLVGVMYAWAGLAWMLDQTRRVTRLASPEVAITLDAGGLEKLHTLVLHPFLLAVAIAAGVVVIHNWGRYREPGLRRKLRLLIATGAVAVVPAVGKQVAELALVSRPGVPALEHLRLGLTLAYDWAMVLLPLAWAYAILRHDVFDVRVVIRRSVQYLLARNVLRIALLLPLALLTVNVLRNPHRTLAQIAAEEPASVVLVAFAALALRFRAQLHQWLARKFFREHYEGEQILLGVVEAIKGSASSAAVPRLVSAGLEHALHPETVHVWRREPEEDVLRLRHSSGSRCALPALAATGTLSRMLEADPTPRNWPSPELTVGAEEASALDGAWARLLVPIGGGDRPLAGIIVLGPKKSEEPYDRTDRRLLAAIAGQMAVVWENDALRERVARSARAQREVLARLAGERVAPVKHCPLCGTCADAEVERCPTDGRELRISFAVPRWVEGKYRLDRLLGEGGMGAVFEAQDVRLSRRVALKVMAAGMDADGDALRRFEREARAVASLNHPHIVTIYDFGPLPGNGAYLVMERLRGRTLRGVLREMLAIAPPVAAPWFAGVFKAVGAAHARGIVHRDLKPENVFVAEDDRGGTVVKVLDFGVAKMRHQDAASAALTVPGTVIGTLGYMSPEQLGGLDVDERSDVFALAVMVVEAITGRHPFFGTDAPDTIAAILSRPCHLAGDDPAVAALDKALQRCLAKDRDQRVPSVEAMAAALLGPLAACPQLVAPLLFGTTPLALDDDLTSKTTL